MTLIQATVSVVGDVECDEDDLLIDGCVRGQVRARRVAVVVSANGRVHGDVRAARVTVDGLVEGTIKADRIELTPTAIVNGSVSANCVIVADGAQINGHIDMDQQTIAVRVARFSAGHPTPRLPADTLHVDAP